MKLTPCSSTLTVFLCLFTTFTSAQIFPDVTPDNIGATVDRIFEIHGDLIDNDYNTVYNFLDDMLPDSSNDPAYDSLCIPPMPNIDSANSTDISVSWNAISGSYTYQAAFMKLNSFPSTNIETGSVTTTNTNAQFNVSNGLIVMVFQNHCTPFKKGRLSIIIVEKPIFFDASAKNCACLYPRSPIVTKYFGTEGDTMKFNYTHEGDIGYYQGDIVNGEVDATFLIKVDFSDDGKITVSRRLSCMTNLFLDPPPYNTALLNREGEEGEDILGALTFSAGIVFDPQPGTTGSFTLMECLQSPPPDGAFVTLSDSPIISATPEGTLNAIPNPAKDLVSIILPADLQIEANRYMLFDAFGKHIHLPPNDYQVDHGAFDIPIGHLPAGVYCFVIHSKEGILKTRFVKIN